MDYDPNLTSCGRMAKQTVRLTFGIWEYRKTMDVVVGGNCSGMDVIDYAVELAHDQLEERSVYCFEKGRDRPYSVIVLAHMSEPDNTMECEDEEFRGYVWLRRMLIAAEIVSIEPDNE